MKAKWKQIVSNTKRLQKKCFWSAFWPRAQPPPQHVLANLRSRCSKLKPFLSLPHCLLPYFSKMRKDIDKRFNRCKLHSRENLTLECEQNWTKLRYWNLLQTRNALPKLLNWVQLKIYSEQTMHQKKLRLVLNGRYSDGIWSLKRWTDCFSQFEELRKKWPKNAQNSLKSSKIAVFHLLIIE